MAITAAGIVAAMVWPGLHAEIRVRRAENERQHQADQHGLHGHLRRSFIRRKGRGHKEHGIN